MGTDWIYTRGVIVGACCDILCMSMSKLNNSTNFPPYCCTVHPLLLHICGNFALTSIDNISCLSTGNPQHLGRAGASLSYEQLALIAIIIWTLLPPRSRTQGVVYKGLSRTPGRFSLKRRFAKISHSRKRPLLGPSPGWKRGLVLSNLRHFEDSRLNRRLMLNLVCRHEIGTSMR